MSAASGPLASAWQALPGATRARLLLGSTGPLHLCEAALAALGGNAALSEPQARACADILLCACAESPLDGRLAREVLDSGLAALFPKPGRAAIEASAALWRQPGDTSALEAVIERRDPPQLMALIEARIKDEPGNLFWRQQAAAVGLFEGDFAWTAARLDLPESSALTPSLAALRGQISLLSGDPEQAFVRFGETARAFGPSFALSRQGLARLAAGERDAALPLLLASLTAGPWQSSAALVAFDILSGRDRETAPLPGRTALLLYSWNKARELDATLASLFASRIEGCTVFALNNGSTDATARVLADWAGRFGPQRLVRIDLPVNVGAPAARNWLLRLPEVAAFDFCAFLDDDILLPEDWLLRLGACLRHHPGAGVVGCKVVDHSQPARLQCVDLHLTVPDGTEDQNPEPNLDRLAPNPFRFSNLHNQSLDCGLFSYARPCASVIGCCHLFCTETLLASGYFAISLSPSQGDDVEHDLRLAAAGRFAAYTGHLTVAHKRKTGAASRVLRPEEANSLGNRYKMQIMHPAGEIRASLRAERALLEADLSAKLAGLDAART